MPSRVPVQWAEHGKVPFRHTAGALPLKHPDSATVVHRKTAYKYGNIILRPHCPALADTHRGTTAYRQARTQPTLKHMQTACTVPDWFGPVRQTCWWEKALKPLGPPHRRMVRAEEPQRCHSAVNPQTHWGRQTKTDRESMSAAGICGLESLLS